MTRMESFDENNILYLTWKKKKKTQCKYIYACKSYSLFSFEKRTKSCLVFYYFSFF
jgi:hypothetical protein